MKLLSSVPLPAFATTASLYGSETQFSHLKRVLTTQRRKLGINIKRDLTLSESCLKDFTVDDFDNNN